VVGRRAYGSPESFDPTHTAVATSNRLPKFSRNDANRGTARRVRIIPFNHPVPQDRIDLRLGQQLRETDHAEAVLAWVVEGAIALQASNGNLPPCAAVEEATTEALDQLFVIRQWADEHLIFEPGHELDLVEVATTFRAWINQQGGESRETNNTIGAALTGPDQAAGLRKSNGKRLITGVRWNPAGIEAARLATAAKK
jgi:phage/plasmid-associated DNA primase